MKWFVVHAGGVDDIEVFADSEESARKMALEQLIKELNEESCGWQVNTCSPCQLMHFGYKCPYDDNMTCGRCGKE